MARSIGIDLGTTNSCAAIVESGNPIIIPNHLGGRLTPSVVRILPNGEAMVGVPATQSLITDPRNTVSGIKRFMGRRFNEVVDISGYTPFEVVIGENNLAVVRAQGSEFTPQAISAIILKYLKDCAEYFLGEEVTQAVITVPAYFGDLQREATREAGEMAGIYVLRIINEPTAAAMAHGLHEAGDKMIMVFDLGGGTLDITVMQVGDGVFEVLSTNGDNFLGGDDFDNFIVEWITQEFFLETGIDLSNDLIAMQRIRSEAVEAKHTLSTVSEVLINIPFVSYEEGKPVHLHLTLTRSKFEDVCAELFDRLELPCQQALSDTWPGMTESHQVVLVGGATRMPKIPEVVERLCGMKIVRLDNRDEVVALGAAIQAGILEGTMDDIVLLDMTSRALGIETQDGASWTIIPRNTTIPTKKNARFSTSSDDQTSVEIHVIQGEDELAINNQSLGRLSLESIPPAPKGEPSIEVEFEIDANGILSVSAEEKTVGRRDLIVVKASTRISESSLPRVRHTQNLTATTDQPL